MSTFANVYVGAAANDGTGDPLRNAFQKINTNFANITGTGGGGGVSSVAGRSGNVVLSVNDVIGAANIYFVTSQVAAGNAYVDGQVAALGNIDVVFLTDRINVIDANVGVISTDITALVSNASTQANALTNLINDVSDINTFLNTQENDINILSGDIEVITANAASQQDSITTLTANAAIQQSNITTLTANAAIQQSSITTLTANAANQAASIDNINNNIIGIENNLITLFANAVNQQGNITTLVANASSQQTQINRIDANIGAYETWANVTLATIDSVIAANTGMKLYVDAQTFGGNIAQIGNIQVVDQTMTGLNDGNPLIIQFSDIQITGYTTVESILTANAVSTVTNTNTGSIQVPNGGIGVAGNVYLGTLPGSRLQVGTGGQLLPDVLAQFTSNVNSYAQVNMQNVNYGTQSTSDYVVTADRGNDTTNFIDLGIAGRDYDNTVPVNSLGTSIRGFDGYLYVQGNNVPYIGNLTIGTVTPNTSTKIIVGGGGEEHIVGIWKQGSLQVIGNILVTGNVSYTMGNSANWTTAPITVAAALDELAARLKAAGF